MLKNWPISASAKYIEFISPGCSNLYKFAVLCAIGVGLYQIAPDCSYPVADFVYTFISSIALPIPTFETSIAAADDIPELVMRGSDSYLWYFF